MNVLILILVQAMFSGADLFKKIATNKLGFSFELFTDVRFICSWLLTGLAVVGQLYVLSRYELSKTMITLGVCSILFSTLLGFLVLKERLTTLNYIGVCCAIIAVILLNLKR